MIIIQVKATDPYRKIIPVITIKTFLLLLQSELDDDNTAEMMMMMMMLMSTAGKKMKTTLRTGQIGKSQK